MIVPFSEQIPADGFVWRKGKLVVPELPSEQKDVHLSSGLNDEWAETASGTTKSFNITVSSAVSSIATLATAIL